MTTLCISPSSHDRGKLRRPDYSWQVRAVECWENAGRTGIIEAVTGSGKTQVAIEALARIHRQDPDLIALVVVPTVPLVEQWYERLKARFPDPQQRVGRIGGKYREVYKVAPLAYVATIQTAWRRAKDLLHDCWDPRCQGRFKSFLIADECHHYIEAPVWRKIIDPSLPWTYRMGLSATIDPYETEGLGNIVFTYSFRDAHRNGLVPAFDLVNAGVDLTEPEMEKYLDLSERISEQFRRVFAEYAFELRNVPDHLLFRRLQQLMGKLGSGLEPQIEKLFRLLFRRAAIYYMAKEKMNLAEAAATRLIARRRKIIVFFERIAAADHVKNTIALQAGRDLQKRLAGSKGLWCRTFHSGMSRQERGQVLDAFRKQNTGALVVCHSLDEGIDIPDVDGAILAASTQSARQRVQRIGRTLRRGNGSKQRPIILTLFARDTGDAGVTENDAAEFQGVADIWGTDTSGGIAVLDALLAGKRPRSATMETPSSQWICMAEGDPIDTSVLARIMWHVRDGQRIRLEYADGSVRVGLYYYCLSHVIWFHGGSAPTDNLIRILKERPADHPNKN